MRNRKLHLKRVLLFLVLPACLVTAGVTLAFMFKTSEERQNEFLPAQVTCAVQETFNGTEKTSLTIQNTGNTAAYLRLRLVSHWVDADGTIVGLASEMPAITYDSDHWKAGNDHTYYYTAPVPAGTATPHNLLTQPMILAESTYLGSTVYQVVEVFADGIQSLPETAVEEAWGVSVQDGMLS